MYNHIVRPSGYAVEDEDRPLSEKGSGFKGLSILPTRFHKC